MVVISILKQNEPIFKNITVQTKKTRLGYTFLLNSQMLYHLQLRLTNEQAFAFLTININSALILFV